MAFVVNILSWEIGNKFDFEDDTELFIWKSSRELMTFMNISRYQACKRILIKTIMILSTNYIQKSLKWLSSSCQPVGWALNYIYSNHDPKLAKYLWEGILGDITAISIITWGNLPVITHRMIPVKEKLDIRIL